MPETDDRRLTFTDCWCPDNFIPIPSAHLTPSCMDFKYPYASARLDMSQDQIFFNSKKWSTDLEKAQTLDELDLEKAALAVASSPHHMLQAQALSNDEIRELCKLFQVCSLH